MKGAELAAPGEGPIGLDLPHVAERELPAVPLVGLAAEADSGVGEVQPSLALRRAMKVQDPPAWPPSG